MFHIIDKFSKDPFVVLPHQGIHTIFKVTGRQMHNQLMVRASIKVTTSWIYPRIFPMFLHEDGSVQTERCGLKQRRTLRWGIREKWHVKCPVSHKYAHVVISLSRTMPSYNAAYLNYLRWWDEKNATARAMFFAGNATVCQYTLRKICTRVYVKAVSRVTNLVFSYSAKGRGQHAYSFVEVMASLWTVISVIWLQRHSLSLMYTFYSFNMRGTLCSL